MFITNSTWAYLVSKPDFVEAARIGHNAYEAVLRLAIQSVATSSQRTSIRPAWHGLDSPDLLIFLLVI
jgi:hypothetical protein